MMYGQSKPRIEDDRVDNLGVRRVTVVQAWKPSRPNMSLQEILIERPPTPDIGLPLEGVTTTRRTGYFETRWSFVGSGESAEFPLKDRQSSTEYSFTPVWSELDLTRHPLWPDFQKTYGARLNPETGRIEWPERMPVGGGVNAGLGLALATGVPGVAAGFAALGARNPMWGRQTYLELTGGTYTHRYAEKKLPPHLFTRLGDIFKTSELPGVPPDVGNRNWLKAAPDYRRAGDIYDITETYLLSDIGGWPQEIYPPRKAR